MTIRNIDDFIRSLPDWGMLKDCFGGRIAPSDIDGCVERLGVALFLEHKQPGQKLSRGQEIMFESFEKKGDTVIVFWGRDNEVTEMRVFGYPGPMSQRPATLEDLRRGCTKWYAYANTQERKAA